MADHRLRLLVIDHSFTTMAVTGMPRTFEKVNPGETVRAYLGFLSPKGHVGKIRVGMEFLVREGARTIGKGVVTKLIELEESARNAANKTT